MLYKFNLYYMFLKSYIRLLSQALAEFYVIDTQYEKAFALYADVSGFNVHLCTIISGYKHSFLF